MGDERDLSRYLKPSFSVTELDITNCLNMPIAVVPILNFATKENRDKVISDIPERAICF